MANIKQKIIRIKTNEKARVRNSQTKSKVRTFIKKTKLGIENNDKNIVDMINKTNKEIDKAVTKGVFKEAKASRIKSRIMIMFNKTKNTNEDKKVASKDKKVTPEEPKVKEK